LEYSDEHIDFIFESVSGVYKIEKVINISFAVRGKKVGFIPDFIGFVVKGGLA
jgi:hypothetical protein